MKKLILVSAILGSGVVVHAQIKVGDNPTVINSNSVLEVESTNKGVLLPRVALTSITDVTTVPAPTNSLLVYNTATSALADYRDNVTPGYYYYSTSTSRWVKLINSSEQDLRQIGRNHISADAGTGSTGTFLGTGFGQDNIAIGSQALNSGITVNGNTALGSNTLSLLQTGKYNTAIGRNSLKNIVSGEGNAAMGWNALNTIGSGSFNLAFGQQSLAVLTAGDYNIGLGWQAGGSTTLGSNNLFLGARAGNTFTGSNRLMIDNTATGTDFPLIDGDFSTKIVKINDTLRVANLASSAAATTGNRPVVADANGQLMIGTAATGLDTTNDAWVNNTANNRVELGSKSDGSVRAAGSDVVIQDDGKVGIGRNNPTEALDVKGGFKALSKFSSTGYGGFYTGNNGLGLGQPATAMFYTPDSVFNPTTDPLTFVSLSGSNANLGYIQDIAGNTGKNSTVSLSENSAGIGYRSNTGTKDSTSGLDLNANGLFLSRNTTDGGAGVNSFLHMYNEGIYLTKHHAASPTGPYTLGTSISINDTSSTNDEMHLSSTNELNGKDAYISLNTTLANPNDAHVRIVANQQAIGSGGTVTDGAQFEIRPNGFTFGNYSTTEPAGNYTFPRTAGNANQVLTTDGMGQLHWDSLAVKADSSPDAWSDNAADTRVELAKTSTGAARATGTEVVVTDNGRIGIGKVAPLENLDIKGSLSNLVSFTGGGYGGFYSGNNGLGLGSAATAMIGMPDSVFHPGADPLAFVSISGPGVNLGYITDITTQSRGATVNLGNDGANMSFNVNPTATTDTNLNFNLEAHNLGLNRRAVNGTDTNSANLGFNDQGIYINHNKNLSNSDTSANISLNSQNAGLNYRAEDATDTISGYFNMGVNGTYFNRNKSNASLSKNNYFGMDDNGFNFGKNQTVPGSGIYTNNTGVSIQEASLGNDEMNINTTNETTGLNAYIALNSTTNNPTDALIRLTANQNPPVVGGPSTDGAELQIRPEGFTFVHYSATASTSNYTFPRMDGQMNQVLGTNGSGQLAWTNSDNTPDGWINDAGNARIQLQTQSDNTTARVAGTEVSILDNGNVGIGTATPSTKLQVVGIPAYASDAAAGSAGLTAGAIYQTNGLGTGIFANIGVLMVKQ